MGCYLNYEFCAKRNERIRINKKTGNLTPTQTFNRNSYDMNHKKFFK